MVWAILLRLVVRGDCLRLHPWQKRQKTHSPLIVVIDHRLRAVHCANDICQYH